MSEQSQPLNGNRDALRERLAALEHDQWMEWSRHLAEREDLSADRLARWQGTWRPYQALTESEKDFDRRFADRVLAVLTEFGLLSPDASADAG